MVLRVSLGQKSCGVFGFKNAEFGIFKSLTALMNV